jgi:hypothetical protein
MFAIIRTRWQTRPLSPRAKRPSSADPGSLRKKDADIVHPQTWYAFLLALPHLGITGSWYKPEAKQELRRQHGHMIAGAIDLHEVAQPEILNPRGVEWEHSCILRSWYVPGKRMGGAASMVIRWRRGAGGPGAPHSSGNPALRRPAK